MEDLGVGRSFGLAQSAFAYHGLAAKASPAGPKHEAKYRANDSYDEKNHPHDVQIDTVGGSRHRPPQDSASGDEEETNRDAHG